MSNPSNQNHPEGSGSDEAAFLKAELSAARERERAAIERADELARFSNALRFTLDSLVCWVDFLGFVGCLLAVASEQLQAPVVEYWSADESNIAKLVLTCRDGKVFEGSDLPADRRTQGVPFLPEMMGANALHATAHFIYDDLLQDRDYRSLYSSIGFDLKTWCEDRGVRRLMHLPLLRGGHCFGGFCAYLPMERTFDQTKIDLAHSLTLQLELSIRLSELSEQAKQAAVLLEREEASKARAAESTQANAILQATLEQLATNRDLLSFPRTILRESMKQLNAQDGVILLLDAASNMLRVSELIAPGGSPADIAEIMGLLVPAGSTASWQILVSYRAAVVLDVERDADMLIPGTQDWLRRRGDRCVVAAPMFLGADPFGYFAMGLRDRPDEISKATSLGLIQQLTQQANLAIQLTRLAESSKQNAIALERQRVVIQEREHLSREIHDKLTQGYAAILMHRNALRRSIESDPSTVNHHLDIIERLAKDNLAEARKTMDDLRIDPLGPGDLQLALENCIHQFDDRYALQVTLECKEKLPPVPHYLELELCRIVGEAVTNACKHSRGTIAKVTVQRIDGRLSILIHDDGIGFDRQAKAPSFGIPSMYERAARAGAELTMTSGPGSGTQVWISVAV